MHIHIPLSGESLIWYSASELPGITCTSLPSNWDSGAGVIGVLHSSKLNLTCYLSFSDRQIASNIFDHYGPGKISEESKEVTISNVYHVVVTFFAVVCSLSTIAKH